MTIIDAMHAANEAITADFAPDLLERTRQQINRHDAKTWEQAREFAAVMVRNGWDVETAAHRAAEKFSASARPLQVLLLDEMETFKGDLGRANS